MTSIDDLDDLTVLSILSYLTEELNQRRPESDTVDIPGAEEARAAIAALLQQTEAVEGRVSPQAVVPENADAYMGRELLRFLSEDDDVGGVVMDLVRNPPEDTQLAGESVIPNLVILGSVMTFLMTKFRLKFTRKHGTNEFEVLIDKRAADAETVRETARALGKVVVRGQ